MAASSTAKGWGIGSGAGTTAPSTPVSQRSAAPGSRRSTAPARSGAAGSDRSTGAGTAASHIGSAASAKARPSKLVEQGDTAFSHAVWELGLLTVMVLVLVISVVLLRR